MRVLAACCAASFASIITEANGSCGAAFCLIYPLSIVPEKYHDLVLLNPMASLIEAWRGLFLHNQLPGADLWPALVFAAAIAAVGAFSFRSMEGGFADAL